MNADAVETILADFRSWLQEAEETPAAEPVEGFDVATVVQLFTALRQEVNLQTKSSRAQLEQNAQTIGLLQQSLESLQSEQTQAEQGGNNEQDERVRPLLKTLIDAHDALFLAQREVQRLLDNLPATPTVSMPIPGAAPPLVKIQLPYWTRWLGLDTSIEKQLAPLRAWSEAQTRPTDTSPTDESAARYRQILDALLVGYRMSLQRIERTFEQQSLESMDCVGEPFDPETMEVAEVVREEGRTSTEVLQVIRRGYLWRGRLFRYAQVRVAKP